MTHVMLDLETMSLAPNAALVSIGAVKMTALGTTSGTFYCNIDLQSSVDAGLRIDPSTVMWWLQQDAPARNSLAKQARPLHDVLQDFTAWAGEQPVIWGNGAAADNVWLAEAYKAVGLPRPWTYKDDRCYRTFRAMHQDVADPPENSEAHNALADAQWQADFMARVCAQKGIVLT